MITLVDIFFPLTKHTISPSAFLFCISVIFRYNCSRIAFYYIFPCDHYYPSMFLIKKPFFIYIDKMGVTETIDQNLIVLLSHYKIYCYMYIKSLVRKITFSYPFFCYISSYVLCRCNIKSRVLNRCPFRHNRFFIDF